MEVLYLMCRRAASPRGEHGSSGYSNTAVKKPSAVTAGAVEDHGRKSNALSVRVLSFEGVALDNRVTEVRG
jgi:hypothetical protein